MPNLIDVMINYVYIIFLFTNLPCFVKRPRAIVIDWALYKYFYYYYYDGQFIFMIRKFGFSQFVSVCSAADIKTLRVTATKYH